MNTKDTFFSKNRTVNFQGTLNSWTSPVVMGILNITPDSFFDGGRYSTTDEIAARCEAIIGEGASIVDVGAYSSRPGAAEITEEQEIERLSVALSIIRKNFGNCLVSVDTFRAGVAEFAVKEYQVQMINDISAGLLDPAMLETVGRLKVPYVMMHMPGNPGTMQQLTRYNDLMNDIIRYFTGRISEAVQCGIHDIIVDPGFGFGKTTGQNYALLSRLDELRIFEKPVLIGLSRKSMIYRVIEKTPEEALAGTIAAGTLALIAGADYIRVHDVKETVDMVKIVRAYMQA